jgi:hypothetical protein
MPAAAACPGRAATAGAVAPAKHSAATKARTGRSRQRRHRVSIDRTPVLLAPTRASAPLPGAAVRAARLLRRGAWDRRAHARAERGHRGIPKLTPSGGHHSPRRGPPFRQPLGGLRPWSADGDRTAPASRMCWSPQGPRGDGDPGDQGACRWLDRVVAWRQTQHADSFPRRRRRSGHQVPRAHPKGRTAACWRAAVNVRQGCPPPRLRDSRERRGCHAF